MKCDVCGRENGIIEIRWTGALKPVKMCYNCLLWSDNDIAKIAREWLKKHNEERLIKDEAAEAGKAGK